MLSNTCKYAVRSVIYLAIHQEEGKKIGIKQISSDLEIPTPFLGKILQTLAKQKILSSNKGPHGGFSLAVDAEELTLLDIVKIIDGMDIFETCLIGMNSCKSADSNSKPCSVHDQFSDIRKKLYDLFKNETFANIVSKVGEKEDYYLL